VPLGVVKQRTEEGRGEERGELHDCEVAVYVVGIHAWYIGTCR
jgi:hypothetical protein